MYGNNQFCILGRGEGEGTCVASAPTRGLRTRAPFGDFVASPEAWDNMGLRVFYN